MKPLQMELSQAKCVIFMVGRYINICQINSVLDSTFIASQNADEVTKGSYIVLHK